MNKSTVNRRASVKNWHNGATPLRPTAVAEEFARANLHDSSKLDLLRKAIRLFETDPKGAKSLLKAVPRSEFGSALDYFAWQQCLALFLKSTDGGSELLRKREAISSFVRSEEGCRRANKRLNHFSRYPNRLPDNIRVVTSRARSYIRQVLGELTPAVLESMILGSRPGSGVAIGTADRRRVSLPFKLSETELCVSDDALPYARMMLESSPHWLRLVTVVDWEKKRAAVPYVRCSENRVAFVPKDASTMRSIAVEPNLNLCLQLGVHKFLVGRLKSVGVNLHEQLHNQVLACKGAEEWQSLDPIVTLDLASASDSVSIGVVHTLLPPAWVDYLDCLRSKSYTLEGAEPALYQKWSSMGNGYTFALESLIFWGLARACISLVDCNNDLGIYGDDICLPRSAAALLIEVLQHFGFRINTEKSALFGPFRESCGEDWWGDTRVVPIYLRGMSRLRPTDIYRLVNGIDPAFNRAGLLPLFTNAHRGRPILFGVKTPWNSASVWQAPFSQVKSAGLVCYVPKWFSWVQRVATFRPHRARISSDVAYAAALFGASNLSGETEAWSHHRGEGFWSLRSETVYPNG